MKTTWGSETRGLCAALLGAALLVAQQPALAEPSAAEKETARKLVKSGRTKLKDGDVSGAIADLQAAHAIMGVPTTAVALGKAQVEAKQLVEARDTLLSVARIPEAPREPRQFVQAREEARQLAREIEPRIPQLQIELRGAEKDADVRVRVDEIDLKPAALSAPLSLNPGSHSVVATIGDREKRTEVTLIEGQKESLVLDLSSLGAERPVVPPTEPESPTETSVSPLVYIGFGVAGAGVLVGSITGIMALSKKSSVDEDCVDDRCPPSTHDDIDSGRTLGNVSTIAFIVGGVGAGVGLYGLLSGGAPEAEKAGAEPFVGIGSAGVRGRF
jgi:hypothetical protein